jgi:hypothetical protein
MWRCCTTSRIASRRPTAGAKTQPGGCDPSAPLPLGRFYFAEKPEVGVPQRCITLGRAILFGIDKRLYVGFEHIASDAHLESVGRGLRENLSWWYSEEKLVCVGENGFFPVKLGPGALDELLRSVPSVYVPATRTQRISYLISILRRMMSFLRRRGNPSWRTASSAARA